MLLDSASEFRVELAKHSLHLRLRGMPRLGGRGGASRTGGILRIAMGGAEGTGGGILHVARGGAEVTFGLRVSAFHAVTTLQADTLRKDGVIEDAASAADRDLRGAAIAPHALLRLAVDSTPALLVVLHLQADVAILTPFTAPRVLDQPVPLAAVVAVAFCKHCMAECRVLCARVEDAAVIIEPVVAVHGHHNWAPLHECLHQRVHLVTGQRAPTRDPRAPRGWPSPRQAGIRARRGVGGVWQLRLQGDTVVPHERVGEFPRGPVATARAAAMLRVWHTVHQGLCREPHIVRTRALQLRFHGLHCGDGPAAATTALLSHSGPNIS
mmetsp:Transcript_111072/g.358609  ORF Transcript_111072/g.358609 Transcript_111072/m.358609 type:complete len:325 (-) Transcript_111072:488-1462(-)